MKIIGFILALIILLGVWFGIYKATTMFDLTNKISPTHNMQKNITDTFDKTRATAESAINSWKQYILSGWQQLILSWQALIDQKKREAEQYLLDQKEKLKAEAQKKLEEEAKKKIQWAFSGR